MPSDRIQQLLDKIEKLQSEDKIGHEREKNNFKIGGFYSCAIDFFACVISSTIIGYIIDRLAGCRFA